MIYYFGCWNEPGHYMHKPDGSTVRMNEQVGPFGNGNMLDGSFPPHIRKSGGTCGERIEDESISVVAHVHGWTVLAMWDRSVDKRGACNAAFVMEGEHDHAAMWDSARRWYPTIVARLAASPKPDVGERLASGLPTE
jgi:hypothetical protein